MSGTMGNTLQASILNLILNGTAIANFADNAASSPATNLYVSLHITNPANGGDQTSNEVSYTGYSRAAVTRNHSSPSWTVTGTSPASASPVAPITFGPCSGGTGGTVYYAAIGRDISGTGMLLWSGALSAPIFISSGVTPVLNVASAITQD